MRFIEARETLPSVIEGEAGHSRQAGRTKSIVLIERQPVTRHCLSRWLQEGSPDRHVVSLRSPVDLLDASRSLSEPGTVIFSIGAAAVTDPDVLHKIILLRRHMSRIPLVLLSDRDSIDDMRRVRSNVSRRVRAKSWRACVRACRTRSSRTSSRSPRAPSRSSFGGS
jgi:DNA-binding NarL/FixJ family response regulator